MGLVTNSGNPRIITGTGGVYATPSWGSVPHTTTAYDAMKRTTSITYADSSDETFSYSGLDTTIIDRNNHKKVQSNDAFGRLSQVKEYTGTSSYTLYATTNYDYDARNLLTQVTDQAGNTTTIGYNGFGRKDSMSDPDMGDWSYTYDIFGNLKTQTDARNCVTTINYDDLNRPTGKTYTGPGACNSTADVTYTYDSTTGGNEGWGRRTGMTDGTFSTTWVYNALGQVTSETHDIGGNYTISGTYDAFSRPLTQTLPSGEVLNYAYNAMGALSSLSGTNTYVSQINYNASGQVTDELLGNGLMQQSCYDANTLRLTNLRAYPGSLQSCTVVNPANAPLNLSYTYQPNGNISQINDRTRGEILNYTYDDLDRLDTVSGPFGMNYDYNTIGNITNKDTTTYTYDATHKHAVASLSGSGGTYTYDANGNMITRVEGGQTFNQTFDAENRLISVTVGGQTTQFNYDPDGNLVKKVNPDNSKTLYVGNVYEVDKNAAGTVTRTVTYYPAGSAMRINSTLYYILKDHLGSASAITDTSGASIGTQRYYPFGETRLTTGTINTDKLFTGQREITGLGIYHYNARFYSPKLGRFLSADTIVPSYANPQSLNRFSYVTNNPLLYIDPTGHGNVCGVTVDECPNDPTPPTPNPATGSGGGSHGGNDEGGDILGPQTPSTIQLAISYLQDSQAGQASYNFLISEGYAFDYSDNCTGHSGNPILVPGASCYNATPTEVAGTIAHEAFHVSNGQNGTLLEEYQAFLIGDIVRNDLIQAGYDKGTGLRHPLSTYTVDLNNPDRNQLSNDLQDWFEHHERKYVTDKAHGGYCNCPALPPPSFWSWLFGP